MSWLAAPCCITACLLVVAALLEGCGGASETLPKCQQPAFNLVTQSMVGTFSMSEGGAMSGTGAFAAKLDVVNMNLRVGTSSNLTFANAGAAYPLGLVKQAFTRAIFQSTTMQAIGYTEIKGGGVPADIKCERHKVPMYAGSDVKNMFATLTLPKLQQGLKCAGNDGTFDTWTFSFSGQELANDGTPLPGRMSQVNGAVKTDANLLIHSLMMSTTAAVGDAGVIETDTVNIIANTVTPTGPTPEDLDYSSWGDCPLVAPYNNVSRQLLEPRNLPSDLGPLARAKVKDFENVAVLDGGWPGFLRTAGALKPRGAGNITADAPLPVPGQFDSSASSLTSGASLGSAGSSESSKSSKSSDSDSFRNSLGSWNSDSLHIGSSDSDTSDLSGSDGISGSRTSGSSGSFMNNWLWAILLGLLLCCLLAACLGAALSKKKKKKRTARKDLPEKEVKKEKVSSPRNGEASPLLAPVQPFEQPLFNIPPLIPRSNSRPAGYSFQPVVSTTPPGSVVLPTVSSKTTTYIPASGGTYPRSVVSSISTPLPMSSRTYPTTTTTYSGSVV